MRGPKTDGGKLALTVNGPAAVPWPKSPPRSSAPGPVAVVLAPERHILSLLKAPHPGHAVEAGTQSATHSNRLPTMSKAPRAETQLLREPVGATVKVLKVLQSVAWSSGPGSGAPFAPTCHSALVGRRLPALAHASCAWNHVMFAEGITDGRLTA